MMSYNEIFRSVSYLEQNSHHALHDYAEDSDLCHIQRALEVSIPRTFAMDQFSKVLFSLGIRDQLLLSCAFSPVSCSVSLIQIMLVPSNTLVHKRMKRF